MMHRRTSIAWALLLLLPVCVLASPPPAIWVTHVDGDRTIEDAWNAGATVLDQTPDILVLADESSAAKLAEAGFDVDGPVPMPEGGFVCVVRHRGVTPIPELIEPDGLEGGPVASVLWSDGWTSILVASGSLEEDERFLDLEWRELRADPVRPPLTDGPPDHLATARVDFGPLVPQMVARVDSATYMRWIGNLAGANEVTISGYADTIFTRHSAHADCDTAERYVYERFLAMGYTDVELDTFTFNDIHARNVIATLPGTETPDQVVILCGHMDATALNPSILAPGANDNASGTSVVLTAAEIMKDYSFRSTIKFIAWTGEEQGLRGSRHYAEAAAAAGEQIIGVVNCDMVAWHQDRYKVDVGTISSYDWLRQIYMQAAADFTDLGTRNVYSYSGSDHVSFIEQGYPAIEIIESDYIFYPCYHRTCDKVDMNDGVFGTKVTIASIATIAYLAEPLISTGVAETDGDGDIPTRHALAPNVPNPFNPSTTIRFTLAAPVEAALEVYDVTGQRVRTLGRGAFDAGEHMVVWDGRNERGGPSASGTYFYRLAAEDEVITRKMILIR